MRIVLLLVLASWTSGALLGQGPVPTTQPVYSAAKIVALQSEAGDPVTGRYDWGPSVMRDGDLYRMWWVRLGGPNQKRFPYAGNLPDGERFEFTYPDRGDRIYYAESRDGLAWNIAGEDYAGKPEDFGPDSAGPLMVLAPAETDQQRMHVGTPTVIRVDGVFYMYYEAASRFILQRDKEGKPAVGNEYHNQVFLATSRDGRTWKHYPDNAQPQPIVPAPEANHLPGRQRYGLGQPSVCYRNGTYILHYVDSCTAPGDFIVRVEANNPYFRDARVFASSLADVAGDVRAPAGAVARFAQMDVKYRRGLWCLVRPAWGTARLGLLVSRNGLFEEDARSVMPGDVYPQVELSDPRGPAYRERLFPRFLTDPSGEIRIENENVIFYYSSGLGFKDKAYTWDLQRCELPAKTITDSAR